MKNGNRYTCKLGRDIPSGYGLDRGKYELISLFADRAKNKMQVRKVGERDDNGER